MFTKNGQVKYKTLIPGVQMRPLVYGEKTILCEFILEQGHALPLHRHPYEQSGYMLSGKMIFHIGDDRIETNPGDSWCIPENVYHEVKVEEDSHVIEIFSPVRPDYLPGE
jgi:quercetin dioxygenase-like cupin family protein